MQKKVVIFDFDGVLADTIKVWFNIHKKFNEALTWKEFCDVCRGNFIEGMQKKKDTEGYIFPTNYEETYDAEMDKISIQDALRIVVTFLAKQYPLYIVSSSTNRAIVSFLQKEKIDQYFTEILSRDNHADKCLKFRSILKKEAVEPSDAVYITDTLGDIHDARTSGIPSVAVTWGHHDIETLREGNPTKIVNNPEELMPAIEEIFAK